MKDLIDTGLEAERVTAIRNAIQAVDGVRHFHHLRTRRMGPDALVDVHIQVDPLLSVSEGHFISETVRQRVIREIDEVQDVLVHIDAEDDEECSRCNHLPGRTRVREILEQAWQGIEAAREIKRMTLHYIGGKIVAEVTLPLSAASTPDEAGRLRQQMQAALAGNTHIERVDVYFS
jgi:divalent metal cation (Fe/Co/Zn/Cd) transporter